MPTPFILGAMAAKGQPERRWSGN